MGARCPGSDKCQTRIREGKREETVYDVSSCLNWGQLLFAPQVLLRLYHFLDVHTSSDDTNAFDKLHEYLSLPGTIYFGFHYSHHLLP